MAVLAYRVQVDHVTLVEKLKDMVRDEHMEVATNLVLSFGLQNSMEKSVLLAHLIRKKRVDLVLRYIESSDFSLKKEVINEFGFKMSNLQLACRLISKLGLSVEDFPEILESKKRQAACWAIELKNFCDFVDDFLLESEELKKFILSKLYLKKMHREFILACKKFSLEHKFQNQLEICHNSIRKKAISLQGDNISPDAEEEFIEHVGPILMIDDMESFEYAKSYVFMKKPRVVGIDCEFKVRCIPFSPKPLVSLLQISIEGVTFCFDMMVYPKYYEEWSTLFEYILVSESILKLGYGLSGDFSELNESFSCLSTCFSNSNPCLDLQDIEKYLVDRSHPLGLAGITELLLQKNLCKDEQISNWEQRPLRISQICYASLDSQILLKLYRAVTELNVPVTDEIRPISVSTEL